VTDVWKKKVCRALCENALQTQGFVVRLKKNARQTIFSRAFSICHASCLKRTAKKLFAVRPIENARQSFSRTVKLGFPVLMRGY
jgi:hypothetical protein